MSSIEKQGTISRELVVMLDEFKGQFKAPTKLPTKKAQDNTIRLVEGAQSPNIQPYHYLHFQNTEVEGIVGEILWQGSLSLA